MIFCAISRLIATRASLTFTIRFPPIVLITLTLPPTTKPKVFQMLPHFRLSADSLDDGVLTGRHQGQRHHTFAFFLRYCD